MLCAEVCRLRLAHAYVHGAGDLGDLQGDTDEGVHIASTAGTWVALVEGFGGLRANGDVLALDPALPDAITRLAFRVRWRDVVLHIEVTD